MTLVIDNPMVEEKFKTIAAITGESLPGAIEAAADERIARLSAKTKTGPDPTVEEILAMVRSFGLERVNNALSEDEILGYGPNGYCE